MSTKPLHNEPASSTALPPSTTLDNVTQKTSLVVSLLALGLMVGGLITTLEGGMTLSVSTKVIPVSAFWQITQVPRGLAVMSAGIILLALLPSVRVGLALYLYLRRRKLLEALVALIVLGELLLSMWLEG